MTLADGYIASPALEHSKNNLSLSDGGSKIAGINLLVGKEPWSLPQQLHIIFENQY